MVSVELLGVAQKDLARALVLQNARVGRQLDPFASWRKPEIEERLRRIGLILSVVGLCLALVLALMGSSRVFGLALAAIFALFFLVLSRLPQLRRAMMARVDSMLVKRAAKLLDPLVAKGSAKIEYTIAEGSLTAKIAPENGEVSSWSRSLAETRYGLFGEVLIALFASRATQRPQILLVVAAGADRERMIAVLASRGLELQALSRELLPQTTLERTW